MKTPRNLLRFLADHAGALPGAFVMLAALGLFVTPASATTHVVTSIPDLGSIASTVGGDEVDVMSICRANTDPHYVEVLPSYMVRVSRAKVYLKVGLSLDSWADQIIDGSHNAAVQIVDCSRGIQPLEVPASRPNASMGDVHPNGNPHYWLDPRNGAIIAHTIAEALGNADPAHAADFTARADAFSRQCDAVLERARQAVEQMPVREIITYHRSWTYLADAFGLSVVGEVEPLPGIPPTGKHLQELITLIQQHKISVLLAEPYFSDSAGTFLGRNTGIGVFTVSPSCDDVNASSYLAHFDKIIEIISEKTDS